MRRLALGLGLVLLLAGCAGLEPLPAAAPVPDLRGTWSGSWGGTPMSLVIVEQGDVGGRSGVYVGPVPVDAVVGGRRDPSIWGVITFDVAGQPVSTGVTGRLGRYTGRIAMVLEAALPDGIQRLLLQRVEPERLVGHGESTFAWGPEGRVELTRRASPGG
jgi:hypothetical protein